MSKWFVLIMVALLIVVIVLDRELGLMMLLFSLLIISTERARGNL